MRAFRGTLTFILGMIIGIILFIVAIGGAIFGIGTLVSVGDLDNALGTDLIGDDSELIDKSIYDFVKALIDDIQNFDKLTVQKLIDKYGLPIPSDIAGIDISPIFKYPILEVPNHLSDIVDGITLKQIGTIAGIEFPDLPILIENLNKGVARAFDAIMGSINGDMTIRFIEDNFGIALGENPLLDAFKDASLGEFGSLINSMPLGALLGINCNSFITSGSNDIFVKTSDDEKYEAVAATDFGKVKDGAKTYAASADENGKIVYKELRFVKKTTITDGETTIKFVVNNKSNAEGFVPAADEQTYYRMREFVPYSAAANYPADTEFFITSYLSDTELQSNGSYTLKRDAMLSLKTLFTDATLSTSLNTKVSSGAIDITSFFLAPTTEGGEAVPFKTYGIAEPLTKDSTFDENLTGYLRAHVGTSSDMLQSLGGLTVATIDDAGDELLNMRLGDIIVIDDTSSEFLQKNKDKTLKEMTEGFDNFCLTDFMSVSMGAYVPDPDGIYTYIAKGNYYTLFNPAIHADSALQRFRNIPDFVVATQAQITSGTGLFYYNTTEKIMQSYTSGDGDLGTLYVAGAPTSKILQRLAGTNLKDFSTSFDGLTLGDVLDIEIDTYTFVANLTSPFTDFVVGTDYFYFDSAKNMYLEAEVFDAAFRTAHNGEKIYTKNIVGDANAILKKLAFLKVSELGTGMTDAIDNLSLGEILNVEVDTYAAVDTAYIAAHPDEIYFRYDNRVYLSADKAYRDDPANAGVQYYRVETVGSGNAILKRLASLKINELGARMSDVIQDMRITEIIPVVEHDQVKTDTTTDASADGKWFIPNVPDLTVGSGDTAEHYAYVYSANGKYYKANGGYGIATATEKTSDGEVFFKYQSLSGYNAGTYAALVGNDKNAGYLYYKTDGDIYVLNPAVTSYLVASNQFDKLYYRVAGTAGDISLPKYMTTNLFVNVAGASNLTGDFVAYDPTLFAHLDADIYVKYGDGETHFFRVDGELPVGAKLYSKERCDYVYFEDPAGTYAYVNGKYVDSDKTGITKYSRQMGVVVARDGNFVSDGGNYIDAISNVKVIVNEAQSTGLLKSFAKNNITMGNLGKAIDTLKLGELINCEEGSILYEFRNSTLKNVSSDMSLRLGKMTIGQMIEWAGVTDMDAKVKGMIENVTLTDFFRSIEFSESKGLTINLIKLFGIK